MVSPQWRNSLEQKLRKGGVPRFYRKRLMDELLDHLEDLDEEIGSMDAQQLETVEERIGTPGEIADVAVAEYRNGCFAARHPVLTFILGPLPLLILVFSVCVLISMLIAWAAGRVMGLESGWAESGWTRDTVSAATWWAMAASFHAWTFVPIVLSALVVGWVARRYGPGGKWIIIGYATLGLAGAMFASQLVFPVEPGTGKFAIGLGFPPGKVQPLDVHPDAIQFATSPVSNLLQFAVPIAIGTLLYRRSVLVARSPLTS